MGIVGEDFINALNTLIFVPPIPLTKSFKYVCCFYICGGVFSMEYEALEAEMDRLLAAMQNVEYDLDAESMVRVGNLLLKFQRMKFDYVKKYEKNELLRQTYEFIIRHKALDVYLGMCAVAYGHQYTDWQQDDMQWLEEQQTACLLRSRGGSKTQDVVVWLIFHQLLNPNEHWAWLSTKSEQLTQAIEYVHLHPFIKDVKRTKTSGYEVEVYNGAKILFGIVGTGNLGRRLDGIVFDEFQNLSTAQQNDVYPQIAGTMTHSPIHKQLFIGTLWIGTLFNEYTKLYPTRTRPWREIPWLVEAGMIQEEIDAGVTPQWVINLQYECVEDAPHGKLFPFIEKGKWEGKGERQYGADFGGTDHWVGVVIDDGVCYVVDAQEVDSGVEPLLIKPYRYVEVEDGGYNTPKALQMFKRIPNVRRVPVTKEWKSERVMIARGFKKIVVCVDDVWEDLNGAVFADDGSYLKDRAHPCHWLDAFLHAIKVSSGGVYNMHRSNFVY